MYDASLSKSLFKINAKIIFCLLSFCLTTSIFANPAGGTIASGTVSIQQSGNTETINQQSQRAIINWQTFNITSQQTTQFNQPNGGVTLNRVNGTQGASEIDGHLNATGQIIIINPAGITFGSGAFVNVGGMIASTSNISDQDFLNGYYNFTQAASTLSSVVNNGQIIAANNGLIALIGGSVQNNGLIQANLGEVVLASGDTFTMSFAGNDMISFAVNGSKKGSVTNSSTGSLIANGGTVLVSAQSASGVLSDVINMNGVAQANSVGTANGEIILSGGTSGEVNVAANLQATGKNTGGTGGEVDITGYNILLNSGTTIDVSGDVGGGNINVGGDVHGAGPLPDANATVMAPTASLLANAVTSGNGGNIVLWSNTATKVFGSISATGGSKSGNGGSVETSSHNYLAINGATVNLKAPKGQTGVWLLDPEDVYITTSASSGGSFDGGNTTNTFTPTTSNSNVLNTTIQSDLANANVLIDTGATGTQSGDIYVNAPITWTTANTLTLSAFRNINVTSTISNAVGGDLVLRADNTGTGTGTVTFNGTKPELNITGTTDIYYNPTTFGTPTNFAPDITSGETYYAYMLVNTLANLQAINNNLSGNYALGTNINAAATSGWNSGAGFVPLGNLTTQFSGAFDGQGFQVTNLTINTPNASNVGLFGLTSNSSLISNISVSGSVTGLSNVGLLVGYNNGYTTNVSSSGTVSAGANALDVGGLIGFNYNALYNAFSTANVTGGTTSNNVGGLIGYNQAYLTNVYSAGNVTVGTGSSNVGGLVGVNYRPILDSYSSSIVTSPLGVTNVGGLVGGNYANIENVYSSGAVNATNTTNVGGLIGINTAYVTDSYSTDSVIGGTNVGGLVGNNQNTVVNSFFNTDTSGLTKGVGTGSATGITGGCYSGSCSNSGTVSLTSQSTFSSWASFSSNWGILPNLSYPYLIAFNPTPPQVIAGNAPVGSNAVVNLVDNGSLLGTSQVGQNGSFYFLESGNTVAASSDLLAFLSGSTVTGDVVTVAPAAGVSITDLSILPNTVQVGENNTSNTLSNTLLATAEGNLAATDPGILYTVSGGNLTLASGVNLNVTLPTTYNLNGNITATKGNLVFNGLVNLAAANPTLTTTTSGDITMLGNINGDGDALTVSTSGINSSISGVISNLTSFVKSGSGTLRLTGVNTYSGTTSFNGGVLSVAADSALGTAPATATAGQLIFNGGTLEVTGATTTINSNRGVLFNSTGGTFQIDSGTTTYLGVIAGAGSLTKTGVGTLILGGANTFTGGTNINVGILNATTNTSLGTGSIAVASGAELLLTGNLTLANAITLNGTGINSAGAVVAGGTDVLSGVVTVASNSTAGVASAADILTVSGTYKPATGITFTQIGLGKLILPTTGTTGGGGTGSGSGNGGGSSGGSGNCGGYGDHGNGHGYGDGDHGYGGGYDNHSWGYGNGYASHNGGYHDNGQGGAWGCITLASNFRI